MRRVYLSVAILLGISALPACSKDNREAIATIDGEKIYRSQFDSYLERRRIPLIEKNRVDQERKRFLQRAALSIAAENAIETSLTEIEDQVKQFRSDLVLNKYFQDLVEKEVTAEKVKAQYKDNIQKYLRRSVEVAHILVRVGNSGDESEELQAHALAKKIRAKLDKGSSFASIAKKYSQDKATARKGGKLGLVREGMVKKPVFDAAFALQKGQVSEPIRGQLGFHILKSLSGPIVNTPQFGEIRARIEHDLRVIVRKEETAKLLESVEIKEISDH